MQQPNAFAKSFLFTTFEAGGVIAPVLAAADKLLVRGHRVRVMSDEANRREIEAAGVGFVPWKRAPSRTDRSRDTDLFHDWAAASPVDGILQVIHNIMCGPALQYAEDLIEELRREPADLVVGSDFLPGVFAACEAIGQNVVLLTSQLSIHPLAGVPPLGPGLEPARTDEERALHDEMRAAGTAMYDAGLPALNAARATLGLDPLAHMTDQFAVAKKRFLGTARAFDFAPDDLPEGIAYVGPQIGPVRWVEADRAQWTSADARPIVAVAFSTTFQNHAGVLQNVIDAGARLDARLVVTLGGVIRPDELRPAANTLLLHSASHDALFADAAAVVTHGGHGTVMRALAARRPMLVIPHGRDQNDNAVRVTARGAGLALPPAAGVDEIEAALKALLGGGRFAAAAHALGTAVAEEATNSPLADELEALATAPARSRAAA